MLQAVEYLIDIVQFTLILHLSTMILVGDRRKLSRKKAFVFAVFQVSVLHISGNTMEGQIPHIAFLYEAIQDMFIIKYLTGQSIMRSFGIDVYLAMLSMPCFLVMLLITKFLGLDNTLHIGLLATILVTPYVYFMIRYFESNKGRSVFEFFRNAYNKFSWFFTLLAVGAPLLFIGYDVSQNYTNYLLKTTSTLYVLTSLVLILFLVTLVNRLRYSQRLLKNQIDTLSEYTTTVNTLHSDIRMYKHDVGNILLSLSTYVDRDDYEGLDTYFQENIEGLQGFNLKAYEILSQLRHLKVESVKGIIFNKYHKALSSDVKFQTGIIEELLSFDVNDVDMCRMLGILLDNAIEAACESYDKRVVVIFDKTTGKDKEQWNIVIENTYDGHTIPMDITGKWKSAKGKGRGIGMKSLRVVLKKYSHVSLETSVDKHIVTQKLIFDI